MAFLWTVDWPALLSLWAEQQSPVPQAETNGAKLWSDQVEEGVVWYQPTGFTDRQADVLLLQGMYLRQLVLQMISKTRLTTFRQSQYRTTFTKQLRHLRTFTCRRLYYRAFTLK